MDRTGTKISVRKLISAYLMNNYSYMYLFYGFLSYE